MPTATPAERPTPAPEVNWRLSMRLLKMVKQLDGMMLIRFREERSLESAWESARNVAWPGPAVTPPAAGDPQAA